MRTLVLNFEELSPALLLQTSVVCLVESQLPLPNSREPSFRTKKTTATVLVHGSVSEFQSSSLGSVRFPRPVIATGGTVTKATMGRHLGSHISQLTAITACPRLTDGGRNYPWEGLWLTPRVRPRPSGNPLLQRRLGQGRSSDEWGSLRRRTIIHQGQN